MKNILVKSSEPLIIYLLSWVTITDVTSEWCPIKVFNYYPYYISYVKTKKIIKLKTTFFLAWYDYYVTIHAKLSWNNWPTTCN